MIENQYKMKIIIVDENHSTLAELLSQHFSIEQDYYSSKHEIQSKMNDFHGLIIRSRFPIDEDFFKASKNLKFIARVGAGLENIDLEAAKRFGVKCYNAPEGNCDAVAEHTVGMMLSLMNHFKRCNLEILNGKWRREENRGEEIKKKTVSLIGYGNMGKATAKRLSGFGCEVITYDIQPNLGDAFARQVEIDEIFKKTDILSFHIPQTPETLGLLNQNYIQKFAKPFYFLNTARGKNVVTKDLVEALKSGKIKAAGLDVLEFEKSSFENLDLVDLPEEFKFLVSAENVILTPHVAGWTRESKCKLAKVIAHKIIADFA